MSLTTAPRRWWEQLRGQPWPRRLLWLLIATLIVLQYPLWLGSGGILSIWKLEREIGVQKTENADLRARNRSLEAEVLDLKQGSEAIEERARSELGMVKKGETFYQVIEAEPRRKEPPVR